MSGNPTRALAICPFFEGVSRAGIKVSFQAVSGQTDWPASRSSCCSLANRGFATKNKMSCPSCLSYHCRVPTEYVLWGIHPGAANQRRSKENDQDGTYAALCDFPFASPRIINRPGDGTRQMKFGRGRCGFAVFRQWWLRRQGNGAHRSNRFVGGLRVPQVLARS